MGTAVKESKPTLPYGSFESFKNFVLRLRKTVVPPAIDASMMANLSGSAKSQLRATLRFLQLTDDEGVVTPRLRELVSSVDSDAWGGTLADTLTNAYSGVLGDLDVTSATLGQLIDRLRTGGNATGSVLRKATRFYLFAMKDAGVPMSPLFHERGLSTVAEGSRSSRTKNGSKTSGAVPVVPPPVAPKQHHTRATDPYKVEDILVQIPGREPILVQLPLDLSDTEWSFIDNYIRGYMSLRVSR